MTIVLAVGLGLLIGLALGALGGGGSILTVPALVYLLGEPPHAAATASLIIVGVTALSGTLTHARAGTVQWKQGFTFGAVSYTHLRAHETPEHLVCRLLLEK